MLGLQIGRLGAVSGQGLSAQIAAIFSAGEQGARYGPSGLGTTYTDTVGTSFSNTATHSGLIVINRPLTASETAMVTRWGNQRAGV